jgi:glyoxylase-like metal-dependent hydrolase (beta-lactamase superfamily II)
VVRSSGELEVLIDHPGPASVETVVAADWEVPLSGLVNLDHPTARAAGLEDRVEPIQIYFHVIRHPEHGFFLVDTGVERALGSDGDEAAIRGLLAWIMKVDEIRIRTDTASWLEEQAEAPAGVFMTHLHVDHVSGLPDLPADTPVYTGPGETLDRSWQHVVVGPNITRALAGKGPIREWAFVAERAGTLESVIDIFGDASVFALHVPGHTPGSTAYLVRTPDGPVLLAGDASHSAWGWEHGVEPGTFSSDRVRSAESLAQLRELLVRHPQIDVRLGHQPLRPARTAALAESSVR